MAARKVPAGATLVEVSGRKAYGARLTIAPAGQKYGAFERDWAPRVYSHNGRKGQWAVIGPDAGYFETVTYPAPSWHKQRNYWSWDGQMLTAVPEELVEDAIRGPVPGADGSWNGARCDCGSPIEGFTSKGFPECEAHYVPKVSELDALSLLPEVYA